jgi:hypothetical protein
MRDLVTYPNVGRKNMSTAKVDVWITATGDACRIATQEHFVYVLHCNGDVLTWCGKTYSGMLTSCGHLEIEIPPGCYIIGAVESTGGVTPLGNGLTHIAVVRANCGDEKCVTLFSSSLHLCGTWLGAAINTYVLGLGFGGGGGGGGPRLAPNVLGALQNAGKAMDALVKVLEPDRLSAATLALAKPRTAANVKAKAKKR